MNNQSRSEANRKDYLNHLDERRRKKRLYMRANYDKRRQRLGIVPRQDYLASIAVDPIQKRLRRKVYDVIFKHLFRNSNRPHKLLGCSPNQLRSHLESLFPPDMSWANYGIYWEIDHIKPLQSFDLSDPQQLTKASHFSNLRPLPAKENCLRNQTKNFVTNP